MKIIDLVLDEVILRFTKWAIRVMWGIISPYLSPLLNFNAVASLYISGFILVFNIRRWADDTRITETLRFKKLTEEARKEMNNFFLFIVVLGYLEKAKKEGRLQPQTLMSLNSTREINVL